MRPERLVVALGTGTEVGKTWVGAAVLGALADAGHRVAARKPAQSFAPGSGPTDAEVLAAATGERPEDVCPRHRWYEVPMAPPMAADLLGRPSFSVADLVAETEWPAGVEVGWVETVGGPRSPMAADGDSAALAAALGPDLLVLVGDARLGAINAVLLSVAVLPAPSMILLNRDDGSEVCARNREWLDSEGLDVVAGPTDLVARIRLALPGNR
ncbi:MAG TPA: dethiobiotin synthase [Acidimicrobiales bacterium]|nr:dethiobiotin synthase [Acidimicrobiales bacterium]